MKLDNVIIQNLCSFYNKLPEHILDKILSDSNIQRYLKGESIEEKIYSLISNSQPYNGKHRSKSSCWKYFINLASDKISHYESVDERIKIFAKKLSEITELSPINTETLIKLNLKKILSSDEFINVINVMDDIYKEENAVDETIIMEEIKMNRYIGFIRLDNFYYYNFYPKYILTSDNKIIPIDNPSDMFPERGNIYLDDGYYKEQIKQFCESNKICVIEFSDDDLIDYSKRDGELNETNKKLRVSDLFQQSKITTLQENGLYLIFESTDDSLNNPLINDRDGLLSEGTQILISYSDRYIGPYPIGYDNSMPFAKINRSADKYVLKSYIIDSYVIVSKRMKDKLSIMDIENVEESYNDYSYDEVVGRKK